MQIINMQPFKVNYTDEVVDYTKNALTWIEIAYLLIVIRNSPGSQRYLPHERLPYVATIHFAAPMLIPLNDGISTT